MGLAAARCEIRLGGLQFRLSQKRFFGVARRTRPGLSGLRVEA